MTQQQARKGKGQPDRRAIAFVGEHVNYSEFQVLWTTMANLTIPQLHALAEAWADTPDRRLARGLALKVLEVEHLRGNLAALVSEPWAAVCLPCPFEPRAMFGEASSAAMAIFAELEELPKQRLRRMAAERRRVPDAVWGPAIERLAEAGVASGFPFRDRVLYWACVSQVEEAIGEAPTDVAVRPGLHGMGAGRVPGGPVGGEPGMVLEGPYWRALG